MYFNNNKKTCTPSYIVLSEIHLGNDNVVIIDELLSELLPLGGEWLAVAAPGSVELDKDI